MSETLSAPVAERVRAAHRRAVFVVGAMAASLIVYAILVEALGRTGVITRTSSASELLRLVFYAVAVSMVFISHVLKAFMLRNFRAAGAEEALARLTSVSVITGAVSETPAVLGLVLFFIGAYYTDFYFMLIISAYLLARHYPRYSTWEQFVRRQAADG